MSIAYLTANQLSQLDRLIADGINAAARQRDQATTEARYQDAQDAIATGRDIRHALSELITAGRGARVDLARWSPVTDPESLPAERRDRSCMYCGATRLLRHDLDVCTDTGSCNTRVIQARALDDARQDGGNHGTRA